MVVADGPIHHVPFDALALPDGRLVVERFAVGSTPSAAIAVRLWKRPAHAGPLAILAFGSPLLGRSSRAPPLAEYRRDTREIQATFAASGGLPPLPSSAKEARMVAGFASLSELRLGERASEAWLKRTSLRRYSVLHFAAHAMVDERAPTHTALALAAGDGEDGFVTPADLATLSLDADLVVLSACRTAGGVVVGGEGVLGLTAPLVQAGARSVVATGWSVGDESAVAFVQSFYETLAEGHDVAEALRMAKLSAIRRGLPMSLWAAFTLIGNPTVRIPLRQRPHRTT